VDQGVIEDQQLGMTVEEVVDNLSSGETEQQDHEELHQKEGWVKAQGLAVRKKSKVIVPL
jgi:hypothetical protein